MYFDMRVSVVEAYNGKSTLNHYRLGDSDGPITMTIKTSAQVIMESAFVGKCVVFHERINFVKNFRFTGRDDADIIHIENEDETLFGE